MNSKKAQNIAVIGGGWYGCTAALQLRKLHHDVTLFESEDALFQKASGHFANRVHAGPHYPRSEATRQQCQQELFQFMAEFSPLIYLSKESIYALAADVDCLISESHFDDVCREFNCLNVIDPDDKRFTNISCAYNVFEAYVKRNAPGPFFQKLFQDMGVRVKTNRRVKRICDTADGTMVDGEPFDWAINCTYYQDFSDNQSKPFNAKFYYEPVAIILVKPLFDSDKGNLGFTVMDGEYGNFTPYMGCEEPLYLMYHANYSRLGAFKKVSDCQAVLEKITDEWAYDTLRPLFEQDIKKYYPSYDTDFKYCRYVTGINTKLKTDSEFRGALVWKSGRTVHVFAGKVNNVIQASKEVTRIIEGEEATMNELTVNKAHKEINDCTEVDEEIYTGLKPWVNL